jgi:hypothetical protein
MLRFRDSFVIEHGTPEFKTIGPVHSFTQYFGNIELLDENHYELTDYDEKYCYRKGTITIEAEPISCEKTQYSCIIGYSGNITIFISPDPEPEINNTHLSLEIKNCHFTIKMTSSYDAMRSWEIIISKIAPAIFQNRLCRFTNNNSEALKFTLEMGYYDSILKSYEDSRKLLDTNLSTIK